MRAFKGGDRYAQLMMGQVDNLPDETLKTLRPLCDKALQEGDPGTADLARGKVYRDGLLDGACRRAARAIPPGPGQRSAGAGGLRAERGLRGYAAEPTGPASVPRTSYGQMMRGVARSKR